MPKASAKRTESLSSSNSGKREVLADGHGQEGISFTSVVGWSCAGQGLRCERLQTALPIGAKIPRLRCSVFVSLRCNASEPFPVPSTHYPGIPQGISETAKNRKGRQDSPPLSVKERVRRSTQGYSAQIFSVKMGVSNVSKTQLISSGVDSRSMMFTKS